MVSLGLGLSAAALAQGVMGQQGNNTLGQNSPSVTVRGVMGARKQQAPLAQGRMGIAPNLSYPATSSARTRLTFTPQPAATLPAGHRPRGGMLEVSPFQAITALTMAAQWWELFFR